MFLIKAEVLNTIENCAALSITWKFGGKKNYTNNTNNFITAHNSEKHKAKETIKCQPFNSKCSYIS